MSGPYVITRRTPVDTDLDDIMQLGDVFLSYCKARWDIQHSDNDDELQNQGRKYGKIAESACPGLHIARTRPGRLVTVSPDATSSPPSKTSTR